MAAGELSDRGGQARFELTGSKVWVAGHAGMVGAALLRRLTEEPVSVMTVERAELDLRRQSDVEKWMAANGPEVVIIAAARVGGIAANAANPAAFLYDNLMIEANIIEAARRTGVARLMLLGSSCIYPRHAPQPIPEDALLTGPLEATNEAYAIAKIAGLKLCETYRGQHGCNFVCAMPCNLYGPGDNYNPATAHVIPALMQRAHTARMTGQSELKVWGSGSPMREFLHVDDCADALVFLLNSYDGDGPINVGSGSEISIGGLARAICDVVGFRGTLAFDTSKPDGTPRKLTDSSRLRALGWQPGISLRDGLRGTYKAFLESERQGTTRHRSDQG